MTRPRAHPDPAPDRAPIRTPGGGSLVETLVAGALLLAILLALLPLLTRARLVVEAGEQAARLSRLTSEALEGRLGKGFREAGDGAPALAFYSRSRHQWRPQPPPPPDLALWKRTVRVRRYPPEALDDGRLEPGEALAPGDDLDGPLLWEVEARVEGGAALLAGGRRGAGLRLLRAF